MRLKKLKETVDTDTLEPLRDLENLCEIRSLNERGLVPELPLALAQAAPRVVVVVGSPNMV